MNPRAHASGTQLSESGERLVPDGRYPPAPDRAGVPSPRAALAGQIPSHPAVDDNPRTSGYRNNTRTAPSRVEKGHRGRGRQRFEQVTAVIRNLAPRAAES